MVKAELILNTLTNVVDSIMFCFCMFLLMLLGVYIFYIFPNKSKLINKQKEEIKELKKQNRKFKKLVITQ